jgi:hypothetical protein
MLVSQPNYRGDFQICLLVPEVRAASIIALMIEAARTSETLVDNYFTRQYIPEGKSELHTRRRENLKSHIVNSFVLIGIERT